MYSPRSASKPLGYASDDAVGIEKRKGEFSLRAVALVHERRARKQVFTDDLQALPHTRTRQQIVFQDVDLTQRAAQKGCRRFGRLRPERREPLWIHTAKGRVGKRKCAPTYGADSASASELGEAIPFVWLQRTCEQRHVEQPQQRVGVAMMR